jgi:SAM-dependent methyltransferase
MSEEIVGYVFGYATLAAHDDALAVSARGERDIVYLHVEGFRRRFNVAMDNRAPLNDRAYYVDPRTRERLDIHVVACNLDADDGRVNGVAIPVTADVLPRFDHRELHYDRVDVTARCTRELGLPVWTYVANELGRLDYERGAAAGRAFIRRTYVEAIERAFRAHGEEAWRDYRASTDPPGRAAPRPRARQARAMTAPLPLTYVLPLRWSDDRELAELTAYLRGVSRDVAEVIVVDGSPPELYAAHGEAWGDLAVHVPPDPHLNYVMGKVDGVETGLRLASNEAVVIGDDDVRYTRDDLEAMVQSLAGAHLVRPQNYFAPLPWHALWDTGPDPAQPGDDRRLPRDARRARLVLPGDRRLRRRRPVREPGADAHRRRGRRARRHPAGRPGRAPPPDDAPLPRPARTPGVRRLHAAGAAVAVPRGRSRGGRGDRGAPPGARRGRRGGVRRAGRARPAPRGRHARVPGHRVADGAAVGRRARGHRLDRGGAAPLPRRHALPRGPDRPRGDAAARAARPARRPRPAPHPDRSPMSDHDPSAYGASVGDYDELYGRLPETDEAVERLFALAGGGAVLEFGIGTGRLALPLAERGLSVAGIEGSQAMADQLRAKTGGDAIEVAIGDFSVVGLDRTFALVALALNTVFALADREAQLACFANAARHLEPGGVFVVEAFVLRPDQLGGGWAITPRIVEADHVELELSRYDAASSRVERTLVHLGPMGTQVVPVVDVYASPGELDLMATAAGLRLRQRWEDWRETAFGALSARHVSVYEK